MFLGNQISIYGPDLESLEPVFQIQTERVSKPDYGTSLRAMIDVSIWEDAQACS